MLLYSTNMFATHIVGGVMYYRYIGSNRYEITMKIYRDCGDLINTGFDGGLNRDGTDAPALIVSLFKESDNSLQQEITGITPVITRVEPVITNPCLDPTNICVEEGVYTFTVTVPNTTDAFYVSYLRCCRNNSIDNLVTPGDIGSTVTVRLPPIATQLNNNAVYINFPPIYICQNSPLVFDHSATDIDGDSLYYELCNPLNGLDNIVPVASSGDSRSVGPYAPVTFLAPYSSSNPLGTPILPATPIDIDHNTGLITGSAPNLGQFVVGVCVHEFRDGVELCNTLRDFQFNVVTCPIPVSNIPSSRIDPSTGIGDFIVNCDNFDVSFINRSVRATRYHWDFGVAGTALDTSNITSPSFTYPDSGTYLVTLVSYNDLNCLDTASAFVKIYPLTFDFTFTNECKDTAVRFTSNVGSISGGIASYSWNFGDASTSPAANPSHLYALPGTYSVSLRIRSSKGCDKTVTKSVIINPLPVASFTVDSACVGVPTGFVNTSTGSIVRYSWNFGDGSPNSTARTPIHSYALAGTYPVTLIVWTDSGCRSSITQNVIVHPLPIIITNNDTSICPRDTVRLNASGGSIYKWTPSLGLSSTVIPNPIATPSISTDYTLQVIDLNRCQSFDTIKIIVFILPLVDAGPDTSVCLAAGSFRDSAQLNASGGVSYLWTPSFSLSNNSIANPWASPDTNTYYYVTITDTNNCKQRDSARVVVLDPQIDIITTKDTGLCIYDSILINVADQGLITTYNWSPTLGLSNANTRLPYFFPLDTTLYILTISNYCYTKDDSVLVKVYPLPTISAGNLDSICYGDSIQLVATGGIIYRWDPNSTLSNDTIADPIATPLVNNRYFVNVTDTLGCSNRDSVDILVFLPPNARILTLPLKICQGDTITMQATGGIKYVWHNGQTLITDSIQNSSAAIIMDTIMYYVDVENVHGCHSNDTVIIKPQLPVQAIAWNDTAGCRGLVTRLNASGGYYYHWSPPTYLTDPDIPNPNTKPDSTITYTVNVSNDCFDDDTSITITIYQLPVANAGPDNTIYRNQTTTLTGTGGETYTWYPVSGLNNPDDAVTVAAPLTTTKYILTVTDLDGCVNYDTVIVYVLKDVVLLIPTAFSPNNDGVNDIFRIAKYLNIERLINFSVFNRWGNLVFETNDIDAGWDGTYKGREQLLGVYVWFVKALDYDGNTIVRKGNVTLLR